MNTRFAVRCSLLVMSVLMQCVPAATAAPIVITEFFNTNLRHYVLITDVAEVAAIEAGAAGPGWQKTGKTINANSVAADAPGLVPVCRFYGSVSPGPNSHFFTGEAAECAAVKNDPGWHYEGIAFYVALPEGGECGDGQVAVWRAYNNGFKPEQGINDGNHRFSVDHASIQKLAGSGWNNEGLVFCAQSDNPSVAVSLTVYPDTLLLTPGMSRDISINVEPRNGFSGPLTLNASGLPPGVSGEFVPSSVTLAAQPVGVLLRLTASGSATPSDSTIVNLKAAANSGASGNAGLSVGIAPAGDPTAARLAAIAAVEQRFQELRAQNLSPLDVVTAVAAFMATLPEYEFTGVHEATICAWGKLRNGTLHIVANNLPTPPISEATARTHSTKLNKLYDVPGEVSARVHHSFGSALPQYTQKPVDDMRSYLRAKRWKLRGGPSNEMHVVSLKDPQKDGFLHLNGHGGMGNEAATAQSPAEWLYSVWTSTVVDSAYEKIFEDDLSAHRLVHMTASTFRTISFFGRPVYQFVQTRYAITHKFVTYYMNFAKESVVWINACSSHSDSTFVDAFLNKNAGAYLGWTGTVYSDSTARSTPYFVDRMLGANMHPDKESPPQRAFGLLNVYADMDKRGLTKDTHNSSVLLLYSLKPGAAHVPIFAPSIKRVRVNEYDEELTLEGFFSVDKPTVTVGGIARNVKTWDGEKITTDLPYSGPGSSGDVIVEVRGVKSNARQLSEWSLPLDYTWTNVYNISKLLISGAHAIRFRADVGAYRPTIAVKPIYDTLGGPPTKDSGITLTASGSSSSAGCTTTLTGAGTYVSPTSPAAAAGTVLASGFRLNGETKTGNLGLSFGSFSSPLSMIISGGEGCQGTFNVAAYMGKLDGFSDVPRRQDDLSQTITLSAANLTLDANYGINARTLVDNEAGGSITVKWPPVPAVPPPRDTDDAGK